MKKHVLRCLTLAVAMAATIAVFWQSRSVEKQDVAPEPLVAESDLILPAEDFAVAAKPIGFQDDAAKASEPSVYGRPSFSPAEASGIADWSSRFRDAILLAESWAHDGEGRWVQSTVLETGFKYPLVHVRNVYESADSLAYVRTSSVASVANHLLITVPAGAHVDDLAESMRRFGVHLEVERPVAEDLYRASLMGISDSSELLTASYALVDQIPQQFPGVEADLDILRHKTGIPAGRFAYTEQERALGLPTLWTAGETADDIIVAVIDSGCHTEHIELVDSLWINDGEVPPALPYYDWDGNGVAGDYHGYDFYRERALTDDFDGHGTAMAGVIGASGYNEGVYSGVAMRTQLMILQFLGHYGTGSDSDAIQCIDYAIAEGAHVLNMSFGGHGANSSLRRAIERARNAGLLVVASAGNDGTNNDTDPIYPASFTLDNIIAVGAYLDGNDRGNYGRNSVDVFAYGDDVEVLLRVNRWDSVELVSGTSPAAAMVSGIAALLWQNAPDATPQQVRSAILNGGKSDSRLTSITTTGKFVEGAGALRRLLPNHPHFARESIFVEAPAVGQSIVFDPQLGGTATTFQWYLDDEPIDGANSSTLTINQAFDSNTPRLYRVEASGAHGTASSQKYLLWRGETDYVVPLPIEHPVYVGDLVEIGFEDYASVEATYLGHELKSEWRISNSVGRLGYWQHGRFNAESGYIRRDEPRFQFVRCSAGAQTILFSREKSDSRDIGMEGPLVLPEVPAPEITGWTLGDTESITLENSGETIEVTADVINVGEHVHYRWDGRHTGGYHGDSTYTFQVEPNDYTFYLSLELRSMLYYLDKKSVRVDVDYVHPIELNELPDVFKWNESGSGSNISAYTLFDTTVAEVEWFVDGVSVGMNPDGGGVFRVTEDMLFRNLHGVVRQPGIEDRYTRVTRVLPWFDYPNLFSMRRDLESLPEVVQPDEGGTLVVEVDDLWRDHLDYTWTRNGVPLEATGLSLDIEPGQGGIYRITARGRGEEANMVSTIDLYVVEARFGIRGGHTVAYRGQPVTMEVKAEPHIDRDWRIFSPDGTSHGWHAMSVYELSPAHSGVWEVHGHWTSRSFRGTLTTEIEVIPVPSQYYSDVSGLYQAGERQVGFNLPWIDEDRDGWDNYAEWAMGTNPRQSDRRSFVLTQDSANPDSLYLTFEANPSTVDRFRWAVQLSEDGKSWPVPAGDMADPAIEWVESTGPEHASYRITLPDMSAYPALFVRLVPIAR